MCIWSACPSTVTSHHYVHRINRQVRACMRIVELKLAVAALLIAALLVIITIMIMITTTILIILILIVIWLVVVLITVIILIAVPVVRITVSTDGLTLELLNIVSSTTSRNAWKPKNWPNPYWNWLPKSPGPQTFALWMFFSLGVRVNFWAVNAVYVAALNVLQLPHMSWCDLTVWHDL